MATKEELEEQLQTARNDIATLTAMAGETAREKARNGVDHVRHKADGLSAETRALYDNARAGGAQLRQQTERQVQEHPLAATGLAFAAGVLVAGVMARR
jgi:ElaB/YqjD/DUF883 family membrane-anchored ribosome-binding protein